MPEQKSPPSGAMRVSAIRFADLWQVLEIEAAAVGVSVSQYVREAALMRAAAAATARGEDPFQLLAGPALDAASAPAARPRAADPAPLHEAGPEVAAPRAPRATSRDWRGRSEAARDAAQAALDDARAITAETQQARRHSRRTRARGQQRD